MAARRYSFTWFLQKQPLTNKRPGENSGFFWPKILMFYPRFRKFAYLSTAWGKNMKLHAFSWIEHIFLNFIAFPSLDPNFKFHDFPLPFYDRVKLCLSFCTQNFWRKQNYQRKYEGSMKESWVHLSAGNPGLQIICWVVVALSNLSHFVSSSKKQRHVFVAHSRLIYSHAYFSIAVFDTETRRKESAGRRKKSSVFIGMGRGMMTSYIGETRLYGDVQLQISHGHMQREMIQSRYHFLPHEQGLFPNNDAESLWAG